MNMPGSKLMVHLKPIAITEMRLENIIKITTPSQMLQNQDQDLILGMQPFQRFAMNLECRLLFCIKCLPLL